ncbi:MAG: DUF4968 domain-containing protein [Sphingobacteriales bacterium]|nr:MAG: DUF4968 domain-containing protein [Sphingobacteriales bacterium]
MRGFFQKQLKFIGVLAGLFFGIHQNIALAQVSISPPNPDVNTDTVTLTFKPKEGNAVLSDFKDAVYIHTGVVTDRSSHPMEWLHVQGEWGIPNPAWEMKLNSEGNYEYKFVIRQFYKVPDGEQILKLMMVFRNADATLVAKSSENSDIVIPISNYEPPYIVMPDGVEATYIGNYKTHSIREAQVTIQTENRSFQIFPYSPDIIRFALSDDQGKFSNQPSNTVVLKPVTVAVKIKEESNRLLISTGELTIIVDKFPVSVSIEKNDKNLLCQKGDVFWKADAKGVRFEIDPTASFYGSGSRAIDIDRKGKFLKLYNNAWYGYTKGADHLNIVAPLLLSNKLWGLYFDNYDKAYFDIGHTKSEVLEYGTKNGELIYYFFSGNTFDELLKSYTRLTGTQPLPPRWALGYIQSRFGYESEQETRQIVDTMLSAGFPVDAIVLDLYWFGKAANMGALDWDRSKFANPEQMMKDLSEKGVKTILITEPYFTRENKNYAIAEKGKLFATDSIGNPYIIKDFWAGPASLIDIFNPRARDWFWEFYHWRIKEGVAGWWCDLGEPERHPADMQHFNGNAERVHNLYSLYWAKMLYENYRKFYPQTRLFNLIRSGYSGMQRFGGITWSGDIQRSFKGLSIQPSIMLGMGLSGFPYMHSDLGGFTDGPKNEELYVRWLQFGMFNPIVRPHGYQVPPEPVFYSEEAQQIVRRYVQLRYRLLPYNYTLAWENSINGTPLARPLFYEEPGNDRLLNIDDTYYWGKSILVAPVLEAGQTQRRFYLPNGYWFDLHHDKLSKGGQFITQDVNIQDIPVWVKAGSFIPMAPVMLNTDSYQADTLIVHYYPHLSVPENYYSLYWDNGKTVNAQSLNQFELIHFNGLVKAKQIKVFVEKTGGHFREMPQKRLIEMVFHNISKTPKKWKLKYNGKKPVMFASLEDYMSSGKGLYYDKEAKCLHLKFEWNYEKTEIRVNP